MYWRTVTCDPPNDSTSRLTCAHSSQISTVVFFALCIFEVLVKILLVFEHAALSPPVFLVMQTVKSTAFVVYYIGFVVELHGTAGAALLTVILWKSLIWCLLSVADAVGSGLPRCVNLSTFVCSALGYLNLRKGVLLEAPALRRGMQQCQAFFVTLRRSFPADMQPLCQQTISNGRDNSTPLDSSKAKNRRWASVVWRHNFQAPVGPYHGHCMYV